jgi:hypothetical protein
MTDQQAVAGNGIGCVIGVLLALAGLAWLTAVFVLPHYKMGYAEERNRSRETIQVSNEMQLHLADPSDVVLVPLLDESLDIFLSRFSFESVPYPDRDNFTLAVADIWCKEHTPLFFPSVRFRNIRSGAVMARRMCALSSSPEATGTYSGTVHNKTADEYASFKVEMIGPNNMIKGCMQVAAPLVGTGPITGRINGRSFDFQLNTTGMNIHFNGTRTGHTVEGSYVVTSNGQTGDFNLHQDSIRVMMPYDTDLDRCPRE